MTYEAVRAFSWITGMFIFISLFVVILAITFWPGARKGHEEASRIPLDHDEPNLPLRRP